ncbi:MAG TPA: hypothetical protein VLM78_02345 [Anaerolineales bacterium]|nr:hypothetical protein [Anaerolineales bacterium]
MSTPVNASKFNRPYGTGNARQVINDLSKFRRRYAAEHPDPGGAS